MIQGILIPLLLCAAQDPQLSPASPKPYVINARIDGELTLADLDGKSHALFAESQGQALLIVFWTYRDPVSCGYAKPLADLQKEFEGRLAILLVDANNDSLVTGVDPLVKMRTVLAEQKVTLPVLLDHGNKLADDFDAVANSQVYLIDANHFLRYRGAIDNDPRGELRNKGAEPIPYLRNALELVLAGERAKDPWTIPNGRPIKRAPKAPAGAKSEPEPGAAKGKGKK